MHIRRTVHPGHPADLMFFSIFELWPSADNNVHSGFDMGVIQQGIVFFFVWSKGKRTTSNVTWKSTYLPYEAIFFFFCLAFPL